MTRDVGARPLLHDVRLIEGALWTTPIVHLLSLCAFSAPAEPMRARVERLFVRNPREIEGEDLESFEERARTVAIAQGVPTLAPVQDGAIRIDGVADSDRVTALLAELSVAPLGSVLPWLLSAELLGTMISYGGTATEVLAPYRALLLRRLTAFAELPPRKFLQWVTGASDVQLDRALRSVLDALRAAAGLASAVRS